MKKYSKDIKLFSYAKTFYMKKDVPDGVSYKIISCVMILFKKDLNCFI